MKPMAKKKSIALSKGDAANLPTPCNQNREAEAFKNIVGTSYKALALDIIRRSAYAIPGYDEDTQTKILCEFLNEMKPQNAIEGMLCAQLALLHFQGIQHLGGAEKTDWRPHIEFDLNAAIKLLRLQHETLDVLMRYRRKGEQRVIVQHVNVNEGGRAIVGHFQSGGGEKIENERGTP
jgi:hypothetical protein